MHSQGYAERSSPVHAAAPKSVYVLVRLFATLASVIKTISALDWRHWLCRVSL